MAAIAIAIVIGIGIVIGIVIGTMAVGAIVVACSTDETTGTATVRRSSGLDGETRGARAVAVDDLMIDEAAALAATIDVRRRLRRRW